MKKIIIWLAKLFKVNLTTEKIVYKDKIVEIEVIKEVPIEVIKEVIKEVNVLPLNTIEGDVNVNGNLLVTGALTVTGEVTCYKINN